MKIVMSSPDKLETGASSVINPLLGNRKISITPEGCILERVYIPAHHEEKPLDPEQTMRELIELMTTCPPWPKDYKDPFSPYFQLEYPEVNYDNVLALFEQAEQLGRSFQVDLRKVSQDPQLEQAIGETCDLADNKQAKDILRIKKYNYDSGGLEDSSGQYDYQRKSFEQIKADTAAGKAPFDIRPGETKSYKIRTMQRLFADFVAGKLTRQNLSEYQDVGKEIAEQVYQQSLRSIREEIGKIEDF